MIALDSSVISELMRPEPAATVVAWVLAQPPAQLCTTAVSVAEVEYGIACLPLGKRRSRLRAAARSVFESFADQILPFDAQGARMYGDIVVQRERVGAPISGFDAQIAAICRAHSVALATRNVADFEHLELDVRNPWTEPAGSSS